MSSRNALIATLILTLFATMVHADDSTTGFYRYPTLHGDTLVFTAQGDLWKVSVRGGTAQALTTHPGMERFAALSPDGRTVAFSAAYEGPTEVYVMPVEGGLPTRITYHGGSTRVVGWTPKGKILYSTRAYSTLPDSQLVAIDPRTLERTQVPLHQADEGVYEPSGKTLFFTRLPFQGSNAKRYKGGTAQQLWKFTEGSAEAVPLTRDYKGISKNPMWWQGRLYFLTDRDGTMNIWSMKPDGSDLRQHTKHDGWDIQTASLDNGQIAYQLGADLHLYNIAAGQDTRLSIQILSDLDQTREKWINDPMAYLSGTDISPDGKKVALLSRGRIFVAPAATGRLVEVTRKSGIRSRQVHFAPDGKSLLALSDASGETEWWRLPLDGGEPEQLSKEATVLKMSGKVSPDGKWIAYTDKNRELWLLDIAARTTKKIAASDYGSITDMRWSPDSRWLAFVFPTETFDRIHLYSLGDGKTIPATSDRFDSSSPAWSPDGKWLYFLSERTFQSRVGAPWGSRQPDPYFDHQTKIYALALTKDARWPFQPADELTPELPKVSKEKPVTVTITVDGLMKRLREVPVPAGNYSDLDISAGRLFWQSQSEDTKSLMAMDITNEKPAPKVLQSGVGGYDLSLNGKKLLITKGRDLFVADAEASGSLAQDDKRVDLSGWTYSIVPREEWKQMFRDAWRMERDYFYDTKMHGLNWNSVLTKYLPLCDRVRDRDELNALEGMMISELSALHTYVFGGDYRRGTDQVVPGTLGAQLRRDTTRGGYVIERIYQGDPDYPNSLAPLAKPEVMAQVGDTLLQVNGSDAFSVPDISVLLRNQTGKQVRLKLREGKTDQTREVIVVPISPAQEADLRYMDWELERRQRVDAESDGAIGYVHLRAMGSDDISQWVRDFYPAFNRQGLIIDVRHNGGGNIDSWILGKLLRRAWFYWQPRVGKPYWNMQWAFRGQVVVLCDEFTGSDGEAFTEGIKRLGIGKVIGTRTWGGEIWLTSSNRQVDSGLAAAPEFGVYADGKWLIEGHGVDPDIVVDNLPGATFRGEDAQLKAAVTYLQREIKAHPNPVPAPPPYPNKAKNRR